MLLKSHFSFSRVLSAFLWCRSVYDGQEHGLFMEKLDARIRNHDREIEKMCNHHFQGFVDSITELLKVRGEAQKLKVRGKGGGTSDGQNSLNLFLSFRVRWLKPTYDFRKMGKWWVRFVIISALQISFSSPVKISDGFPSSQLIGSMEELKQCRVQQRNIATTIDKLALCLPGNPEHHWINVVTRYRTGCPVLNHIQL